MKTFQNLLILVLVPLSNNISQEYVLFQNPKISCDMYTHTHMYIRLYIYPLTLLIADIDQTLVFALPRNEVDRQ